MNELEKISNDNEIDHILRQFEIKELENVLLKLDQAECKITHAFANGIYARTMNVDANTLIIGKRHRFECINVITKGKVLVSQNGLPAEEKTAPCTFVSGNMVKKIIISLEDSEWITFHPTKETDLEKIEDETIIPEDEYLLEFENKGVIT